MNKLPGTGYNKLQIAEEIRALLIASRQAPFFVFSYAAPSHLRASEGLVCGEGFTTVEFSHRAD